jgi:AcrR family transcriptional regulator
MDKRKIILDAALKLFVEFGFHGTPTSKIAKEAGVANGTLFHYFATKDDLILALYIDIKSRMIGCMMEHTKDDGSLKDTLKNQYLTTLYWALDNPSEFHFVQQFNTSPFHLTKAAKETEKYIKPFMNMLSQGIKDKIIKPLPVELIFTLISSHTFGLNQYLVSNQFAKVVQHQYINETFELLWDMIT